MQKLSYLLLGFLIGIVVPIESFGRNAHLTETRSPEAALSLIQIGSSISGHVLDSSHHPVEKARIQLLDEADGLLRTVLTDGSGGYSFRGLSNGTFQVRVMVFGTNFVEPAVERVNINTFGHQGGISGSQSVQQDFTLLTKEEATTKSSGNGVVFTQEVPEPARKAYIEAIKFLDVEKNDAQGLEELKKAVALFPNYFWALQRLGMEYVKRQQYELAAATFTKGARVNPDSAETWYWLGVSQFRLKQMPEALETLRRASKLAPKSAATQLQMGIVLYAANKLDEAETSFKQASKLSGKNLPVIHLHLAQLYDKSKRYKEEADELELYLKNQSDDPNAAKYKQIIENLRRKTS